MFRLVTVVLIRKGKRKWIMKIRPKDSLKNGSHTVSLWPTFYYIQLKLLEVTYEGMRILTMMRRYGWCRFIDHYQSPDQPLSRLPGSFVIYLVLMNWVDNESNMSCVCVRSKFLSILYLPPLIYTRTLRPLNIPETAILHSTNLQWVKIENRVKNWILGSQWTTSTAVQKQR